MEDNTRNELNGILENLDKEIAELQKTVTSPQEKAQIKNLLDKIENRKKLPDFSLVISVETMKKAKTDRVITMSEVLKANNVDAADIDKQTLKNLQIRAEGLRATLEMVDSLEQAGEDK